MAVTVIESGHDRLVSCFKLDHKIHAIKLTLAECTTQCLVLPIFQPLDRYIVVGQTNFNNALFDEAAGYEMCARSNRPLPQILPIGSLKISVYLLRGFLSVSHSLSSSSTVVLLYLVEFLFHFVALIVASVIAPIEVLM